MTRDELDARYRLLKEIVAGKSGRTFTAEHRASRRAVLVHFLDEEVSASGRQWSALLSQLTPKDQAKILETMRVDRSLVVVTQVLDGFETLESWLRSRAASQPSPPSVSVPPTPSAGEFTQLFQGWNEPGTATSIVPAATQDQSPPHPRQPGPGRRPAPSPGDFTDLFRGPGAELSAPKPSDAAVAPVTPTVNVPIPSPLLKQQQPRPPIVSPNLGGGEGEGQARPVPAPILRREIANPQESPPAPSSPPPKSGPSEFTRQLRRITRRSTVAHTSPENAKPAEPGTSERPSLIPLLLGLNLIVIIATGLILYFALKRC